MQVQNDFEWLDLTFHSLSGPLETKKLADAKGFLYKPPASVCSAVAFLSIVVEKGRHGRRCEITVLISTSMRICGGEGAPEVL